MKKLRRLSAIIFALAFLHTTAPSSVAQSSRTQQLIIAGSKPYTALVRQIEALGGKVTFQFKYVNAIAAELPESAVPSISDIVGLDAISKDDIIPAPRPVDELRRGIAQNLGMYVGGNAVSPKRIFPASPAKVPSDAAYNVNHSGLEIRQLHVDGYTGKDVVVAVIDSGIRPGYASLDLDGSVIGAEDFVPDPHPAGTPEPDNSISINNDPHGTFVSSLISGNASFDLGGTLKRAISEHFPGALDRNTLSLFGTAPESKIYSLRVFSRDAIAGAPKSRVMAAIERVIELREMYDRGDRDGVNIRVCNLSLGTSTIHAGRTPFEALIDELLKKDIVPVVAAGNVGPALLTTGSPGTSFSALSVAASSPAANERVFRDVDGYLGPGVAWRPTTHLQTAWFSSRGPTADGRTGLGVYAAGFGVLGQGCGSSYRGVLGWTCTNDRSVIDISSGTSFSAPIVSGVAAVLRQRFPNATAAQIRDALISKAVSEGVLGDNSTSFDQGQGRVNAAFAADLLQQNGASNALPRPTNASSDVETNIERSGDLIVNHGVAIVHYSNLKPGERKDVLIQVPVNTSQVIVTLFNVTPELPPSQQNQLFGDDIFLNIHSAKTSSIGAFGDYALIPNGGFTLGGTFVVPDPEPGIIRVSVMGDMSNAGRISADVNVTVVPGLPKTFTHSGTLRDGRFVDIPVTVPAGKTSLDLYLEWDQNWSKYPTNDIDMILFDPNGGVDGLTGATLSDPERVTITNPTPGLWFIRILGFAIPTRSDNYRLRVTIN